MVLSSAPQGNGQDYIGLSHPTEFNFFVEICDQERRNIMIKSYDLIVSALDSVYLVNFKQHAALFRRYHLLRRGKTATPRA